MRLRVRHPQGVLTVEDLTPEQSVESLCKAIESLIGLSSEKWVQVSGGFPPKPITDRNISLQSAGIKNGDALNVTLVDPPPSLRNVMPVSTSSSPAIAVRDGFLVQRVMDDDNSCLFRSIGYVLERDSSTMVHALRQVVAQAIQDDPETYLDVLLGQPRSKYIEWIKKDTSWGGAIELSIFSKHYNVEIVSVDVQTGRMDRFGEGAFSERVFILYSGIHYDALALSPMENCSNEFDETRFPASNDDSLLLAAQELASVLRRDHKYTDVANFSLKCENCQTGLVGEKDAQAHAMSTGHTNFVEYT
ncbi:hypothetical protein BCR42DRAFT_449960 [Absidia repens]|uniref:Ubiquitin thioesterase OTU n=1 Tax=Absidia repens TaxID=90262 RepID=A0A1X2IM36_9FUNG|nr:hypothetical protein BCR42DRAFT_449960 [Absidia repens]